MTGAKEVGVVGSPRGRATVLLRLDPTSARVAFTQLRLDGVVQGAGDAVTELHIHRGVAGVAGPVVVDLTAGLGGAGRAGVLADRALVRRILTDPGNWYVNVHTSNHPDGAVRGQLTDCMVAW